MSGTLATHVHVYDAAGVVHVFGPDDTVPSWASALILNPDAWAGEPPPAADDDDATTPKRRPGRPPKPATDR